ncbi:hypothetical protein [Hymenobacter elongatus]|uniref:Uncharacterized protein n=1 Tax=Hymenobacter elongatus TaxID=877208 RepID=A0A4Z0PI67_9BACT|nr:hypothetical protein [Hymenobacter elongatus]TGE14534.1 hypothetical protein E5J99_15855 [Hymenobacter elongatus]
MFRSLFLFRRLLATTFLVVFVNVFVGQCYCATASPARSTGAAAAPQPTPAKPTHPGCHGHTAATAKPQKSKTTQPHKSAGKHDCCKDKSASLLSSLTIPVEKSVLVLAPALLPAATSFTFQPAAAAWDRTGAVVLVARQHLPPKIPDIRIFIQSLTV